MRGVAAMWGYVADVVADMDRVVSVMLACGVSVRTYEDPPDWALSNHGDAVAAPEAQAMKERLRLLTRARQAAPRTRWTFDFDGQSPPWSDVDGYLGGL